jgi:uncharacterized protein (TIGR02391 family)
VESHTSKPTLESSKPASKPKAVASRAITDNKLTKADRIELLMWLHPNIREKAGPLWLDSHYSESISAACLVVMKLLRQRAGSEPLDGQPLITKVLRGGRGKQSRKSGVVDMQGIQSERDGIADLASGLWRAYRTPLAHRDITKDGMEALEVLMLASLLVRRIETDT